MQQDRDRRHAHAPEGYLYRSSSDYVSTRSPPYSDRMATQYQQSRRLPEPHFRGTPTIDAQRAREESYYFSHIRRFEQSPSRTESFPRPEPRDHPPTQGSRPYWDAARDDHLRPQPASLPPAQYRDPPRHEPTLHVDRAYSRRPEPGFGHRGGERLSDIPPRPPISQSTYGPRESDRPQAWIPSSPPRPRSVSWSERRRQPAHEDWARSQSPPRPHPPPPPTARWPESNMSTNPRWGHSRVNSASLDNRRIHSRTSTDAHIQAPWDLQAPPRARSPLQETASRNFHRNLVPEIPSPPSSRDFYEVHTSVQGAPPRIEPRNYPQPGFREPLPRPPSARRDDPIPFVMPLPTDLSRERPTSSHGSHRSQNYQDSPYTRTAAPPPPHAPFSPVTPFSAGLPRQGRDTASSRAPNTLPTPPVAAGLPPRPQSTVSWPKENAKPPSRAPSFVEHTRPDVRRISDPYRRRRSSQLSPTISPSSAGPEQMVHPAGWPKKPARPTPPVSTPYSTWGKKSPVPRIRPPDMPRPFEGSVTPSEAPQDRPMKQNRYVPLSGSIISYEETFAQERPPEMSNSRSFPQKHYMTDVMVPSPPMRPSPEPPRPGPQQPGMTGLWKPDPPRLPTGSPSWAQSKRPVDMDTPPIPLEPPVEAPINHDVEFPLPIEDEIKSESPPVEYRHIFNDEPREWQGATRTLRRAAEERIQDQELPVLRKTIAQWIFAENKTTAATHTPVKQQGQTSSRQNIGLDGRPITPPSKDAMFQVLSKVFAAEGETQQQKIERLKADYRQLAHRWIRHCRELDDGNLPVEIEEAEPFPARGNRRNRLEFVRTDYEAEQAVERLQDLARYDAVLLGRINAATVPDMISVASRSSRLHKFHDTNGDILNPEEFYDYEHVDHWTQEEVDAFHSQMELHGKRFGLVACHPALKKKTPQDCVRYYYMEKADDKFRALLEPRNRKTVKRTTRSATTTQAGPGSLMADIERVKEKGRAAATDMEVEETDDSAYEVESAPRKGRGRGRGRGGWRGRARGNQAVHRQQRESTTELEGDGLQDSVLATPTETTATQFANLTVNTPGDDRPPGKKPPFPSLTKTRKRKGRELDDGDLSVDSPSVSNFGSGITDTPTPVPKRQISSYWHVADREHIKSLLLQYGENWDAIAKFLSYKSPNQVRNYVRGKPELLSILEERKLQTQPTDQPPLWVNGPIPVMNSQNGTPARSPSVSR